MSRTIQEYSLCIVIHLGSLSLLKKFKIHESAVKVHAASYEDECHRDALEVYSWAVIFFVYV